GERLVLLAVPLDLNAAAVLDGHGRLDQDPRLALVLELGEPLDGREVGLEVAGPIRRLQHELRVLGRAGRRVAGDALLRHDRPPDLLFEEGLGRDALLGLLGLTTGRAGHAQGREGEDRPVPDRSILARALDSMLAHGLSLRSISKFTRVHSRHVAVAIAGITVAVAGIAVAVTGIAVAVTGIAVAVAGIAVAVAGVLGHALALAVDAHLARATIPAAATAGVGSALAAVALRHAGAGQRIVHRLGEALDALALRLATVDHAHTIAATFLEVAVAGVELKVAERVAELLVAGDDPDADRIVD